MREAYRLYVAESLKKPQKAPKGPRQGGPSGAFKAWVEEHPPRPPRHTKCAPALTPGASPDRVIFVTL